MMSDFQAKVLQLDRSVRARGDEHASGLLELMVGGSGKAGSGGVLGNALVVPLLDDAILSEQPSAAELTFFRDASLDLNVPLGDLADSVTAVISTVVKLRSGIPDDHEQKLMRSHLNTVGIEMQLLAKHLESLDDQLRLDPDHWLKREAANIADAMRTLEEKVGLFRLYLKDVAGPTGAAHRHKLLFASQYLVETAVQLLRAVDLAALEAVIQMAVRTALVAQRIFSIAFRPRRSTSSADSASDGAAAARERHTPLKSLMPLLTDCLVTLTNAVWKRGLQLPDAYLRQQLDDTCANIGACARVFIDVCAERRKMVMRNAKRPSSSSSDRLRERVTVAAAAAAAAAASRDGGEDSVSRRSSRKSDRGGGGGGGDDDDNDDDADPDPDDKAAAKSDLTKRANEALDLLQLQLAHMCALLTASGDSPAPGASLAAEVDRARKQLFRVVDTHLHTENTLRPDGGRSGPSKAELSGNAVLRLAMLLKRLVVDFESLKLVPGSLVTSAAALAGEAADERPVTRVASMQSLSKLVRELTQMASSLLEHMPPSPALQQVHVYVVVARRYLMRLQLACMAQVAGSPIQVHVPLPLLLRGMTATLSLLVRGLDEIGVLRAEREAWRNSRSYKSLARHRRRTRASSQTSAESPAAPPQTSSALGMSPPPQPSQQPSQQPQQAAGAQQPQSTASSLSNSATNVRRESPSAEHETSRSGSLRDTSSQRSGSLRQRESPTSSRPNSRPGSLRNELADRRSVELAVDAVAVAPARSSSGGKRKSIPAGAKLHEIED